MLLKAPAPTDKQQLQYLPGVIGSYGKFLPGLFTLLHFLHRLLQLRMSWNWRKSCQQALDRVKELLASAPVLTHCDVNLPLQLECDASPYWVGALLSHIEENESTKAVAH